MERNLDLRIEIDADGNFKVVSAEPESGMTSLVVAGNIDRARDQEIWQIGHEVLSWIDIWVDELKESGK